MNTCVACGNSLPDGCKACNICGQLVDEWKQDPKLGTGPFGIPNRPNAYSEEKLPGQGTSKSSFLARASPLLLLVVVFWGGFMVNRAKVKSLRASRDTRCAQLAQQLARSRAGDAAAAEVIGAVYSPRRNSCMVAVEHRDSQGYSVRVIDSVTQEPVWSGGCRIPDECNERLMSSIRTRSKATLDGLGAEH